MGTASPSPPVGSKPRPRELTRRGLTRGIAWATPTAAISLAAPAFAASTTQYAYRLRTSWYTSYADQYDQNYGCYRPTSLAFTLTRPQNADGAGFAIRNEPSSTGKLSPTTGATLNRYVLSVSYPSGMINLSANPRFTFSSSSGPTNWSGPVYVGRENIRGEDGYTRSYDTFRFTWKGATRGSTTPPNGNATTPWPGSTSLDGTWAANYYQHCRSSRNFQYQIRKEYDIVTDNGFKRTHDARYWTTARTQ